MPNAPVAICRHLSSGTLMGDKPAPWVSPKYKWPTAIYVPLCLSNAPRRCSMILRACFPYAFPSTKSPLIGTEPKKSFEAWPRTVPFYDVVTWKKMPGASNGAGSVELARVKSPRKNRKVVLQPLREAGCKEHAVWNGKLVKSRSSTGKGPLKSQAGRSYDVERRPGLSRPPRSSNGQVCPAGGTKYRGERV